LSWALWASWGYLAGREETIAGGVVCKMGREKGDAKGVLSG